MEENEDNHKEPIINPTVPESMPVPKNPILGNFKRKTPIFPLTNHQS